MEVHDYEQLGEELRQARSSADILASAARAAWANERSKEPFPETAIPTLEHLNQWYRRCSRRVMSEAAERTVALCDATLARWRDADLAASWKVARLHVDMIDAVLNFLDGSNPDHYSRRISRGILGGGFHESPGPRLPIRPVHILWQAHADLNAPPPHPLTIIVAEWLKTAHPAVPFKPKRRASLPAVERTRREPDIDPSFPEGIPNAPLPGTGQMEFAEAGFGPPGDICPPWLTEMLKRSTLLRRKTWKKRETDPGIVHGRGAPWALRLMIGALLHLGIDDRDGQWRTLRFSPSQIERWLHLDGWTNRRRDWDKFTAALNDLNRHLAFASIPGLGEVAVVLVTVIPEHPSDPFIEFTIRIPKPAAHGHRVDWQKLCDYGVRSAMLYRCYLVAMAMLGHSSHKGNPVTRRIAPPLLGPDGKPLRDRHKTVRRQQDKLTANPLERYVPQVSFKNLTAMAGLDPDLRYHRHRTRKAFEQLAIDGVIELDIRGREVRLFGPRPRSGQNQP